MMPEPSTQLAHYRLDPSASTFKVQAFAEGLLSVFGHDPVIGIKDFSGEAEFVTGTFENAALSLTVRAASLVVVNDIKQKDRQEIERTMREDVLETQKYPQIEFKSNNVTLNKVAENSYRARVIGQLTLHGVTQNNLGLNAEVVVTPEGLRAKGKCSIKQSDFKIKRVSVAAGTMKIKNELKCEFDILGRKQ